MFRDKIEYYSKVYVTALKNRIKQCSNEYQQKIILRRDIKQIIEEIDASRTCLDSENMEALELFKKCG